MKVNKLSIKNRLTGNVIFEFEKENNTIKDTLLNAILNGADLSGAYLSGADLRSAYLIGADLRSADLSGADLIGAYLRGAYLSGADLRGADLRGADLRSADLSGADLSGADLRGADLRGADLRGADLRGNKIKSLEVLSGLYDYLVIPYITESGDKRIKMGCHDRLLSEWESNFWNNNEEFPNNESIKSKKRLLAFNTAKEYLKLMES